MYELTRKGFKYLFPKLKPGGIYIIEDWAWSLHKESQKVSHPWYDKPSLINILFELIVEIGAYCEIEEIIVNPRMVIIKKNSIDPENTEILKNNMLCNRKLSFHL